LRGWGHAAFFFVDLLRVCRPALRRFGLVVAPGARHRQPLAGHHPGLGLAVGFVLALQMYYALVAYGAAESLGLIVNLALVRELGPVVTALLFAGRAGTSLTAEIGLMKAGEQISAMELMAIDPRAACWRRASWAASSRCPSWRLFSAIGIIGAWSWRCC
jgi:phospholipid/cholesterol/gamma-HCH transport system permease protein